MGAIRLFLACGVAFAHAMVLVLVPHGLIGNPLWMANVAGARPVLFFYVVSGFLISFVLETKYGPNLKGSIGFYRARFLRIYPLWWAVLIVAMVMTHQYLGTSHFILGATLLGADWLVSFWNYPSTYWLMFPSPLGIAWTLAAEVAFYLLAPFVLRSNRIAVGLFVISAAVRGASLYAVPAGVPTHLIWVYFFFPSTLLFFLLGHFARLLFNHIPIGTIGSVVLFGMSLTLSSMEQSPSVEGLLSHASVVCFALALPRIFEITKNNPVSNFLGDLTYPLYLTHTLVVMALFGPYRSSWIGIWILQSAEALASPNSRAAYVIALTLACSIIGAVVGHFVLEIPARAIVSGALASIAKLRRVGLAKMAQVGRPTMVRRKAHVSAAASLVETAMADGRPAAGEHLRP